MKYIIDINKIKICKYKSVNKIIALNGIPYLISLFTLDKLRWQ